MLTKVVIMSILVTLKLKVDKLPSSPEKDEILHLIGDLAGVING